MTVTAFPGDRRRVAPLEIDEVQKMLAYWRELDAAITARTDVRRQASDANAALRRAGL